MVFIKKRTKMKFRENRMNYFTVAFKKLSIFLEKKKFFSNIFKYFTKTIYFFNNL